jgi:hypothetical protein
MSAEFRLLGNQRTALICLLSALNPMSAELSPVTGWKTALMAPPLGASCSTA